MAGIILTRSNIIDLNTEAPFPVGIEDGTLTFNTNTTSGLGYVWRTILHTWNLWIHIGKKRTLRNQLQTLQQVT
jgi:hypothetical protein